MKRLYFDKKSGMTNITRDEQKRANSKAASLSDLRETFNLRFGRTDFLEIYMYYHDIKSSKKMKVDNWHDLLYGANWADAWGEPYVKYLAYFDL